MKGAHEEMRELIGEMAKNYPGEVSPAETPASPFARTRTEITEVVREEDETENPMPMEVASL